MGHSKTGSCRQCENGGLACELSREDQTEASPLVGLDAITAGPNSTDSPSPSTTRAQKEIPTAINTDQQSSKPISRPASPVKRYSVPRITEGRACFPSPQPFEDDAPKMSETECDSDSFPSDGSTYGSISDDYSSESESEGASSSIASESCSPFSATSYDCMDLSDMDGASTFRSRGAGETNSNANGKRQAPVQGGSGSGNGFAGGKRSIDAGQGGAGNGNGRKRQRNYNSCADGASEDDGKLVACPYYKHNPQAFSDCSKWKNSSISRMKCVSPCHLKPAADTGPGRT